MVKNYVFFLYIYSFFFSCIKLSNNFPHLTIVKSIALRLSFEVTPAIRLHNKLYKRKSRSSNENHRDVRTKMNYKLRFRKNGEKKHRV